MSPRAAPALRITGLTSYVTRTLHRLAASSTAAELEEIHGSIQRHSRQLEISLNHRRLTAANLTPTSRSLRAWLALLSDPETLNTYTTALTRCTIALDQHIHQQRRWKPPISVFFRPLRGLYHARQSKTGLELSLPTPALCFTESDWPHVARYVLLNDKPSARYLIDRTAAPDYRALATKLESLAGPVDGGAGQAHDLAQSFTRVNAQYFNNQMPRPTLTWSRSATFRKFGHYDFTTDTVMLSRSLDSPEVPPYVVDFLLYHELLHKAHGLRWTPTSSRGYAHTKAFYADEKRFTHHQQAEAFLKKLSSAGRRRKR